MESRLPRVLFVCVQNAGRSQMAQALYERRGGEGRSAGSSPADRVHPEVVEAMREVGLEVGDRTPEGPRARGRRVGRARRDDGLRRRVPGAAREALRGLGAAGPGGCAARGGPRGAGRDRRPLARAQYIGHTQRSFLAPQPISASQALEPLRSPQLEEVATAPTRDKLPDSLSQCEDSSLLDEVWAMPGKARRAGQADAVPPQSAACPNDPAATEKAELEPHRVIFPRQ